MGVALSANVQKPLASHNVVKKMDSVSASQELLARNAIDAPTDFGIWELKGVSPVLATLTTPWEEDVTKALDSASVFQE